MLGKSVKIKSKLQEKKKEKEKEEKICLSLFFPLFHIIYIKCFFVTMQIFLVFSGIAATVLWDESAKKIKSHPIEQKKRNIQ